AAEVLRVLRPGGSLHLVDFAGEAHGVHGLLARRVHSDRLADNGGDGIPRLLDAAGFECAEVAARRHPILGRITYYRATRPSS
ncbi:MAG TPA: SAM-dependent methyltransferase, partial [Amycolatopsis sp.]|nr:SAM-dependent methyltransferase [Amycolatopsis sp.]